MNESQYEVVGNGVAIYKQKTSRFWWCSITVEVEHRKEYKRLSTKKLERLEAIERAIELKLELKIKKDYNIPLNDNAPNFEKICKLLIKEFNKKERQRSTYVTYILNWNRMIEFFNNKRIDNISSFNIIEYFDNYKINSKTQITTARTSFKKVYEYALYRNLIRKIDIPELPRIENKSEIERDYFDKKDLEVFFNSENMNEFIRNSRKSYTKEIRELFFLYCEFILKTGLRAGTESLNVKYKNFYFDNFRNDRSLGHLASSRELYLKVEEGKVSEKQKRVIPLSIEIDYIFIRLDLLRKTDSRELIESRSNKYLFRINQNKEVNFIDCFNQYKEFLELKNYEINKNKTLYSFRHTYITDKLIKGVDIHTVAKATGTSTAMIDKHYSKLTAILKKEELTSII